MNNSQIKENDLRRTKNMQNNKKTKNKKIKNNRKKISPFMKLIRCLKRILMLFVILFVISMGIVLGVVKDKFNKLNYKELELSNLGISNEVDDALSDYRNIVLFGVDTRDITKNEHSRSDAIIIISINKKTKDVNLISVYRDTYVNIAGHGLDKITHAYAYGGPELAIKTLNQNLDLNIKEYATVNFASVANIINAMGGIEVNIEDYEIEQMNKYIKDTSKNTGISSNNITSAGLQNLDGVQAVTYSRIRKTVGGDYKRTERMRTVLTEALKKSKKMNVVELNNLIDILCENVETNLSSKQITYLMPQVLSFDIKTSIGWPYEVRGITLDKWYGVAVNLEDNVSKLHSELFNQENYEVSKTVKDISQQIIKKTKIK